ncbi:MAG: type II toxin-antitoxin system VapC family toxin [Gemmatimonadales bacterium]|nr:type II toxin-antitoxin system VapC family toxin [Candidatus Palauibacter irciniicola]MYE11648.1 type II toxin-antitoxin system VapC family toxin [Gammaproteobacteria bacterium]
MILLDTHVLVWLVEDDRRLGPGARSRIERTRDAEGLGVSAITPWEIAMLVATGGLHLALEVGVWVDRALSLPAVALLPIEPAIAVDSVRLPGEFHADPADRLIVATARHWPATLLTGDQAILRYAAGGHFDAIDAGI